MEQLSACGLYNCAGCKFQEDGSCLGCLQGNTFLDQWGRNRCAIFDCVRSQGLASCNDCGRTSCALRGTTDSICPLRGGKEGKRHWAWRIAQHLEKKGAPCHRTAPIPLKTMMRLRWYLSALEAFDEQGVEVISSRELAEKVGINPALVRKDLACFGELGTRGLGYRTAHLQDQIGSAVSRQTCSLVWVGAQWLANAVGMFAPSPTLNFRIVAAFDVRPEWIGKQIGDWQVLDLSELPGLMTRVRVDGAILALPEDAVRAADSLVQAGVKGILNLTPVAVRTPPEVSVHHIDLLGEIMALALECGDFHSAA